MKPMLLLDIDGVLLPFNLDYGIDLAIDFDEHDLGIPPYHGALAELGEDFNIIWASLHEGRSNSTGAQFNMPERPHIPFDYLVMHDKTFKLPTIKEYAKDLPLAWVDDDLYEDAFEWAQRRNQAIPTLLIKTDPMVGLEDRHIDKLKQFAKDNK